MLNLSFEPLLPQIGSSSKRYPRRYLTSFSLTRVYSQSIQGSTSQKCCKARLEEVLRQMLDRLQLKQSSTVGEVKGAHLKSVTKPELCFLESDKSLTNLTEIVPHFRINSTHLEQHCVRHQVTIPQIFLKPQPNSSCHHRCQR